MRELTVIYTHGSLEYFSPPVLLRPMFFVFRYIMVCLLCAFSVHTGVNASVTKTLKILTWEAYLSPSVIALWEQKTAVKIELILFDNDQRRNDIMNKNYGNIDIVILDEVSSRYFGEKQQLIPINNDNLSNLSNIEAKWLRQCGDYSSPYFWGTLGLAYRKDILKTPPTSWQDIIHPADYLSGHIAMSKDYTDLFLPSLFLRGESITSAKESVLKEIYSELLEQVKHILTFEYPVSYLNQQPVANELYLTMAYSGDEISLNNITHSDSWAFVIPQEGTIIWTDCLAVSATSKQQTLALEFIDFLYQPEIAALNTLETGFSTANREAYEQLLKQGKINQSHYPNTDILAKIQFYSTKDVLNVYERSRITQSIVKRFNQLKSEKK